MNNDIDTRRNYIYWFTDKKDKHKYQETFYVDFYSFACIEYNIRKAYACNGDMDAGYGRLGWTMLLMFYCRVLEELYCRYPDTSYVIPQKFMEKAKAIQKAPSRIKHHVVQYDLGMTDREAMFNLILAGKYIQYIIRLEADIKLDDLETTIKKIEHGINKKEESDD